MRCCDNFLQRENRLRGVLTKRKAALSEHSDSDLQKLCDVLSAERMATNDVLNGVEQVLNACVAAREERQKQVNAYEVALAKRHAQIQALHFAPIAPTNAKTKAMLTARASPPTKITASAKPRPKAKSTAKWVKGSSVLRRFASAKRKACPIKSRPPSGNPRRPPESAKEAPPEVPAVITVSPVTSPHDERHTPEVSTDSVLGTGPTNFFVGAPVGKGQKNCSGLWPMSELLTRSRAKALLQPKCT